MKLKTIGVVGAGVMGRGVAHNLAQSGFNVVLLDISDEKLKKAAEEIENNIRTMAMFSQDKTMGDSREALDKITFASDLQLLATADYVIENVIEKWEIKKDVHKTLDEICPDHCVFAANTSVIPITKIASATGREDKVIGIHFMNPVPMKKMAEVIRGYHTSEETIEITKALLSDMGKEMILVEDSPGFVINRVFMLTINEAIYEVQEKIAPPEDIDSLFKECLGHSMGPLETADLIGLDTILYSLEALWESFKDSKYRPCPLLEKMVDAGLLGRKSGQGFYKHFIF